MSKAGDIHIVPDDDSAHYGIDCYCCPVLEYQDPYTLRRVYVHHTKDEGN